MLIEHFQNLVIGRGEAGKFLAWSLAKLGQKTALIERFRIPASHVMRMRALSEPRGFMTALIGGDDRIPGFTAFCAEASEAMAVVQTAMLGDMPYTAFRHEIFTHPTASEGLNVLFTTGASNTAARAKQTPPFPSGIGESSHVANT